MNQTNIAIIGYSGHAFVVLDACNKSNRMIKYYCDRNEQINNVYKLTYIGNEDSESFDWGVANSFVLGIGDNHLRNKVAQFIIGKGREIHTVIHPTAVINDFATIGSGTFISSHAVINPLANIGNYCIVNTGAIIEHECIIGAASHIAPGAVLAGNVSVGIKTFIGANSTVKQGVIIGDHVVIGAGSVVIQNIPSGETWVGNPAKRIK